MKRRHWPGIVIACILLMITGCGNGFPVLPDNPIVFHAGTFVNPEDEEDTFSSIEYDGRSYILYGALKGRISKSDIESCLGFIVQDGEKMADVRVYRLKADPDANYLVEYLTEGEMEQLTFLRAIDTAGEEIYTPPFIDDLGYQFWNGQ